MSSEEVAIRVSGLGKCYQIYDRPGDRLKQFIYPKLAKLLCWGMAGQYFREYWALQDISFEVKKGETFGVIGANGSGKSTLLQLICKTLSPSVGQVAVNGRVAALLELGSGFNPEFTGCENVFMNAAVLGLGYQEIHDRYQDIVGFADIGDFIDQPVKMYSSGMVVRLAFAVIAHVDADILVIDEALSVGDVFFNQKCMRFLRNFMKKGSVIFVSHDTNAILNLCDRGIYLEKGKIKIIGSPKKIVENYLEAYYEVQQEKNMLPIEHEIKMDSIAKNDDEIVDMRQSFINSSNYRNDIKVHSFLENSASFGNGAAKIVSACLKDSKGRKLSWVVGGELVVLEIICVANSSLLNPIVGFQLKDRLGQTLFGDNTYITFKSHPCPIYPDDQLIAQFEFRMPWLQAADYSISAAIADGTQDSHLQCDWLHEALQLSVHASPINLGLIGIPMKAIRLKVNQK